MIAKNHFSTEALAKWLILETNLIVDELYIRQETVHILFLFSEPSIGLWGSI